MAGGVVVTNSFSSIATLGESLWFGDILRMHSISPTRMKCYVSAASVPRQRDKRFFSTSQMYGAVSTWDAESSRNAQTFFVFNLELLHREKAGTAERVWSRSNNVAPSFQEVVTQFIWWHRIHRCIFQVSLLLRWSAITPN